ncbi:MAG: pirin [Actinobacteria bacterium HGW-Actinobacteria-4]|nr:MAG: pirin [Actinobacteria bacterium HGW-Actinobacteria-4]
MSNLDAAPDEVAYTPSERPPADIQVIDGRDVPLGGPRALTVRRTLPHRERSFVGAWCFADHYGPANTGMDVPPHPHTGLQTVSWLFSGEVEHRDSMGTHALIRPGEMNLMTSGAGIAHSEVSTSSSSTLHGVQLWVALPAGDAHGPRGFQSFATEAVDWADAPLAKVTGGGQVRVFLGDVAGIASPVPTFSPLLGAEVTLNAGASVEWPVNPRLEHGVLVDRGPVEVGGTVVHPHDLGFVAQGRDSLRLSALPDRPARVVLLGGEPLNDEIVMWWNFVGRSHEEIVRARDQWQAQDARFGAVAGYEGALAWLPAPELPNARLKTRRRLP